MHVFKFGGSCLTGPESLPRIRERIGAVGTPVVAVFSALKGVTDRLLDLADAALRGTGGDPEALIAEHLAYLEPLDEPWRAAARAAFAPLADELRRTLKGIEYLGEASAKSLDRIMSIGERAAVVLAEALLGSAGLPVERLADGDPGFSTDGIHGDARVLPGQEAAVRARYADPSKVYLVPGFVAPGPDGAITTLGRGGSDYTATYLGAALGATTTLWKDTRGLLTTDPNVVPEAARIERLHFLDALELAHYGTEAIADKAVLPAMEAKTPIEIRSFERPEIRTRIDGGDAAALAITCVRRAAMIDFLGLKGGMLRTLANLFEALASMPVYPLLLTEASPRGETSLVVKEADVSRLEAYLRDAEVREKPVIRRDLGVVSMIGSYMCGRVGMAAAIFECLASAEINIVAIAQTASERNVSVTVARGHVEAAVRALHARFIETK